MNYKQLKFIRKGFVPLHIAAMVIIAFSMIQNSLLAEGSVDFRSDPGYRLFYFAEKYQQIKVYAGVGEFINMGSSHIGISGGTMSIYRPDGTLHTVFNNNGATAGLGIINNDVEELNGPTGGGTTVGPGYIPGVVEVQNGEEGIWTVLLEYPFYNNVGFSNLLNSDPWSRSIHQPTIRRVVLAWDITVSQNGAGNNGGNLLTGRVYSNEYQSIVNQNGNLASPSYYLLTSDGYQYEIGFDNIDPWGFPVFSNTWGVVDNGDLIQPTYKTHMEDNVLRSDDPSSWLNDQKYLYEPQAKDIDEITNNKVFFNLPDPSMPSLALVTDIKGPNRTGVNDTHTTWLYIIPTPVVLDLKDLNLVGVDNEGNPLPDGVLAQNFGAFIDYETNIAGTATLTVDINNDGIFGNESDRIIYKRAKVGSGTIFWDGKDNSGNILPLGLNQTLDITLEIAGGELHLMMTDIENVEGGVNFTRINGENAPVSTYLYNHENIGGPISGNNPLNPEPTELPYSYSNNLGDNAIFDYWTYVKYASKTGSVLVDIVSDPSLISVDTDNDGVRDDDDIDDDNDGIPDVRELCPIQTDYGCLPNGMNPANDADSDGIPNYKDANDPAIGFTCVDNNNDGECDIIPAIYDLDGDNIPNHLDLDSDNDGISDLFEANHQMQDADGDGRIDGTKDEFGDNGLFNVIATNANDFEATENYTVNDADQDGVMDAMDLDSDNDGLHDMAEAGFATIDQNNNGTFDIGETNIFFDATGVASFISFQVTGQAIPNPIDSDNDEIVNYRDLDSDNDGITDVVEGGNEDVDEDGEIGKGSLTVNINGVPISDEDGNTVVSTSMLDNQDNDAYPNYIDHDSDNDGIHDTAEAGYTDTDNDGFAGAGNLTTTSNGLISLDVEGAFSYNNPLDLDTDAIPNYLDMDSDNDGIHDVAEGGNEDPDDDGTIGLNFPNTNNFGVPISDNSGNTFMSSSFPTSSDTDPIPDYLDLDSDNDGINDVIEGGNEDPDNDGHINSGTPPVNINGVAISGAGNILATSFPSDSDGDNFPSYLDLDSDNDGINDVTEGGNDDLDNDGEIGFANPNSNSDGQIIAADGNLLSTSFPKDFDGDMIPDYQDLDSDNDGINDVTEGGNRDPDNDGHIGVGLPNTNDSGQVLDPNGTIIPTSNPTNSDGTGEPDYNDLDSDDDGILDVVEADLPDADGNGIVGDGIQNVNEDGQIILYDNAGNLILITSNPTDTDGDGTPDYQDIDSDNDSILDEEECLGGSPCPDTDGDGIDDWRDSDCIFDVSTPTVNVDDQSCVSQFIYFSVNEASTYETTYAPNQVSYTWYNGLGLQLPGTSSTYGIFATDVDLIFPITVIVSVEDCASVPSAGVTIQPSPVPSAQASVNAETICEGEDIQLTANTISGASYTWTNLATGNVVSNLQNPIVQALDETTTFELTVAIAGCTEQGTDNVSVTVNPVPVISDVLGAGTYCAGENILLSAQANNIQTGEITYTWTGPNVNYTNTVPVNTTLEHSVPEADFSYIGTYTLNVMTEDGCGAIQESLQINIQNEVQKPELEINGSEFCTSEMIDLVCSTSSEPNAVYNWFFNGNLLASTTVPNYSFVPTSSLNSGDYEVQVEAGLCGAVNSDVVQVSVFDPTVTPTVDVGNSSTVCEGEQLNLNVVSPVDNTVYTWYDSNGNVVETGITLSINNLTLGQAGNYSLEANTNGCGVEETTISIDVIQSIPTPVIDLSNNMVCDGGEVTLIISNDAVVNSAIYNWYDANGNLISQTNAPSLTLSNVSSGDADTYSVIVKVGDCSSAEANAVSFTVVASPNEVANAGPDMSSCQIGNFALSANTPVFGTGTWSSPTATILEPNNPNTEVTNLTQGPNVFVWTLASTSCGVYSRDSLWVTYTTPPNEAANIIQDEIFACQSMNVEISASIPTVSIGTWTQASGPTAVSFDDVNDHNTTIINLSPGTYVFDWSLEFANCGVFSTDQVIVHVDELPMVPANAGVDRTICGDQELNLNAIAPGIGTGMWTSQTASIVEPNNPNSLVNNLQEGENVFTWAVSNGACTNYSADQVIVNYSQQPSELAQVLQNTLKICASNLNSFSLEAVPNKTSTGTWVQTAGPVPVTIDEPNKFSTTVQGLAPGTFVFEWVLSFGACGEYDKDAVEITIDAIPNIVAEAGADITICGNQELNLNAIAPSLGTGVWTSQTANVAEPSNPNSTASNLQEGQNIFTWSISNGACTNYSTDQVIVNYLQQPSDVAQVLQNNLRICESDVDNISLDAVAISSSTGNWIQTAGPVATSIDNPNDFSTTVQGLAPGTYVFEWILSFGNCGEYDKDQLEITVDAIPSILAEAGEDITICGDQEVNLTAIMPSIGTGVWTSTDGVISDPNEPFTNVTNLNLGANTFIWTLTNGSCVDYSSDEMVITLLEEPEEQAMVLNDNLKVCEDDLNNILLNAVPTMDAVGTWIQTSGPSTVTIDQPNNPSTSVQGLTAGMFTFEWSLSFGTCGTYSDANLNLEVSEIPDEVAQTQADKIICGDPNQEITAATPQVGTGYWTSTTSTISDPNSSNTMVSLVNGINVFTWTLSNDACEDYSSDELIIEYTSSPTEEAQILIDDIEICASDLSDIQLAAQNPNQSTGMWTMVTGPDVVMIENPNSIQTSVTDLVPGTYVFAWTLSAGSCVDFSMDQITVEVVAVPDEDAMVIESEIVTCNTENVTIEALTSAFGTGSWTSPTGAIIVSPNDAVSQVTNLQVGENIFVWSLSNGVCEDYSQDFMTIILEDAVIANNDIYNIDFDQTLVVNDIVNNDELNGTTNWETNIINQPSTGSVTFNMDGTFEYIPDPSFSGQVSFEYEICNTECGSCDVATVTIMVNREESSECHVPNILTPNQDMKNDVLMIPCVSQYPNNQICIFNRWGDQIYEVQSYQNDWNGQYDGKDLPAGTYFYVFKTSPEDQSAMTGYITILR